MTDVFVHARHPGRPLPAAAAAGFAAMAFLVLFLREILALFFGNEILAGLALAVGLAGAALGAFFFPRLALGRRPAELLAPALGLTAVLMPAAILAIRLMRPWLGIHPGQTPSLAAVLAASALCCGPVCLVLGFAASACLATAGSHPKWSARPLAAVVAAALGAAAGGLFVQFVAIPRLSPVNACLDMALGLAAVGLFCAAGTSESRRMETWLSLLGLLCVLALPISGLLDAKSRAWEWGPDLAADRDTPRNELAVLASGGHTAFFADNNWLFAVPDPLAAELVAHPPLLMHPAPRRVLCIGGGISGVLAQILKQPDVAAVDSLEIDAGLLELARQKTPDAAKALDDARVNALSEDPAAFVRNSPAGVYDVILVALGAPPNLQANRLATLEFFQACRRALAPGGLVACAGPGVGAAPGPDRLLALQSLRASLSAAFPAILALPGDPTLVLARQDGPFPPPQATMEQALADRGLDALDNLRDAGLPDMTAPKRLAFLETLLAAPSRPVAPNQDRSPACFAFGLGETYARLSRTPFSVALALAFALAALPALAARTGRLGAFGAAGRIRAGVLTAGLAQAAGSAAILLGYQILTGRLYGHLAGLASAQAAGLALGAALFWRRANLSKRPGRGLALLQAAACLCLPALAVALPPLFQQPAFLAQAGLSLAAFGGLALILGLVGGAHFAAAVAASNAQVPRDVAVRDFFIMGAAGAALGALAFGLAAFPFYGLAGGLSLMLVLGLGGLAALTL